MNLHYLPSEQEVKDAVSSGNGCLAVISFDRSNAYIGLNDLYYEHHIMMSYFDVRNYEDNSFRIYFDNETAEWTFYCPADYKAVQSEPQRVAQYYNDGLSVIKDFLQLIGIGKVPIVIPKRYQYQLKSII